MHVFYLVHNLLSSAFCFCYIFFLQLPDTSGAICSVASLWIDDDALDQLNATDCQLYVGTNMNQILTGSALRSTTYTVVVDVGVV